MRSLFYCDTSYQLLTILNIVCSFDIKKADLVVYHNFHGSRELIQRVKKSGIFENVYDVFAEKQSSLKEAVDMTFARAYLKNIGFKFYKYDDYFAACLDTVVSLNLYSVVDYRRFNLLDDGIGSYYSNILSGDYMSSKRLMVLKLSHPFRKYFFVDALYVYSPELCESTASEKRIKIPLNFSNKIDAIFQYKANNIYEKNTIILEQPCTFKELSENRHKLDLRFNKILEANNLVDDIIVRLHPRMTQSQIGQNYDNVKNQWELECRNQIDDSNTLVAIHSTSIFQPTIMFDKYPRMILLYELYKDALSESEYTRIKDFVKKIISAYRGARIFVPLSFEELEQLIIDK